MSELLQDPVSILLAQIWELSASLEEAISAIAKNSLIELENSLWHQEMRSASLKHCIRMMRDVTIPSERQEALRDAAAKLHMANTIYECVVRQGCHTADILRSIHGLSGSAVGEQSTPIFCSMSYEV